MVNAWDELHRLWAAIGGDKENSPTDVGLKAFLIVYALPRFVLVLLAS